MVDIDEKISWYIDELKKHADDGRYSEILFHNKIIDKRYQWEISNPYELESYLREEFGRFALNGYKIKLKPSRKIQTSFGKDFFEQIDRIESDHQKKIFLFSPERVQYSILRLEHYTHSDIKDFQNYILLTNYDMHMQIFAKKFDVTWSTYPCQMPVLHYKLPNNEGITMINIGVWPSNAKTITDHLAVLRPKLFLMIWHCGWLRKNQNIWDIVIADKFITDTGLINKIYKRNLPIVPTISVNSAILDLVIKKGINYRVGTVFTTEDRNRELQMEKYKIDFLEDRSVGIDMESAVICLQWFKYKIPNATLLIVSDKPLEWLIKSPVSAKKFYNKSKSIHIKLACDIIELLKSKYPSGLISHIEYPSPTSAKDNSVMR